jgi:hypothetical protein
MPWRVRNGFMGAICDAGCCAACLLKPIFCFFWPMRRLSRNQFGAFAMLASPRPKHYVS